MAFPKRAVIAFASLGFAAHVLGAAHVRFSSADCAPRRAARPRGDVALHSRAPVAQPRAPHPVDRPRVERFPPFSSRPRGASPIPPSRRCPKADPSSDRSNQCGVAPGAWPLASLRAPPPHASSLLTTMRPHSLSTIAPRTKHVIRPLFQASRRSYQVARNASTSAQLGVIGVVFSETLLNISTRRPAPLVGQLLVVAHARRRASIAEQNPPCQRGRPPLLFPFARRKEPSRKQVETRPRRASRLRRRDFSRFPPPPPHALWPSRDRSAAQDNPSSILRNSAPADRFDA